MSSKRRKNRELALQILFQQEYNSFPLENNNWVLEKAEALKDPQATPLDQDAKDFIKDLVEGTLKDLEDIDQKIGALSQNWSLSRMSLVDKNILRMSLYELKSGQTPPKVIINEACELAKTFSHVDSTGFINALLDQSLKSS